MPQTKKLEMMLSRWAQLAAQRNAYDYNIVKRLYVSAPMTRSSIGVPTYEFSMPVHQGDTHGFTKSSHMLHTAVLGTLFTDCSLLALHAEDPQERFAVTSDVGFTCLNSAFEGDELVIKAEVLRVGKTMGIARCAINAGDKVIAVGRHSAQFVGKPGSALNTDQPHGADFV
jgi:acyl-coenzyme A thioesterase PaaI-like protein